jgi:hypothetical protein
VGVIRRHSVWALVFAAIGALALSPPCTAQPLGGGVEDRGTFAISIAGKDVGTEQFEIRSTKDRIEAKGKVEIRAEQGGRQIQFQTFPDLVLDSRLLPETYSWRQTAPRSSALRINFLVSPATARYRILSGKTDLREFSLPKGVVVLDDNVLNHYEILVVRYLRTSKGQQSFRAFIPQEAMPGQLNMEEASNQEIDVGGKKLKARRFMVTTDLSRIELWTDKAGHLERVSNPAIQLTAVRH